MSAWLPFKNHTRANSELRAAFKIICASGRRSSWRFRKTTEDIGFAVIHTKRVNNMDNDIALAKRNNTLQEQAHLVERARCFPPMGHMYHGVYTGGVQWLSRRFMEIVMRCAHHTCSFALQLSFCECSVALFAGSMRMLFEVISVVECTADFVVQW